ncbi:hypothetical protein D9753_06140 [Streptomyces dangxiongensis]|uniref:Guanylate cyclase domain-containing protein n=1 Tax=Streptomyces dangxiongensis TaxID=1442032 RepID=A0A3G2JAD1_9ACTN|nr:hypothetical protein [Streptomyces dangxiongensis]AYN38571.1 hypothetical protein D9753_06140 [Streptomyces dangxiongensis]
MHDDSPELPTTTADPHHRSRPLPPYRGILAVDMKGFTRRPAIEHEVLSRALPELLRTSLEHAGLADVWNGRLFPATTGDGYILGFDPTLMPLVIHPWLHTLQDVLAELDAHALGTARIRLRVGLHIGPLPDTADAFGGNGTARTDTHRLLDSRPVRAVLADHSEHVTYVAAVLSDRCYTDAVVSGYAGRHPHAFIEVPATVDGKPFAQRAWLYVPAPSGPLPGRTTSADRAQAPAAANPSRAVTGTLRADRGIINTGLVRGGQHLTNLDRSARPEPEAGHDA